MNNDTLVNVYTQEDSKLTPRSSHINQDYAQWKIKCRNTKIKKTSSQIGCTIII